jgi:hypothetical protein
MGGVIPANHRTELTDPFEREHVIDTVNVLKSTHFVAMPVATG